MTAYTAEALRDAAIALPVSPGDTILSRLADGTEVRSRVERVNRAYEDGLYVTTNNVEGGEASPVAVVIVRTDGKWFTLTDDNLTPREDQVERWIAGLGLTRVKLVAA